MYNNIGLQTARGSGTNGYVQSNLANLIFSKKKVEYNAEEDIARAEAEVNKAPNAELLDHEYKRTIEIKCVEFEDLMEDKGFTEEEIKEKVSEYRKLLYNEFESGNLNMDNELDLRNSHTRAKVAKENKDRMRYALGIDASFVDGSSLEKLKKASEKLMKELPQKDKETLDKEMEKSMMQKLYEKIKEAREKKRKRGESSSSSSTTSSSSDSSDSSSEAESTTSSSSSDSSVERRKAKRKKRGISDSQIKKEIKEEPMSERHIERRHGKAESNFGRDRVNKSKEREQKDTRHHEDKSRRHRFDDANKSERSPRREKESRKEERRRHSPTPESRRRSKSVERVHRYERRDRGDDKERGSRRSRNRSSEREAERNKKHRH